MTWIWPTLLVSGVVTMMSVPLIRHAMLATGLVDIPNQRSSHVVATPRGGGLACAIGVVVGVAVSSVLGVGALPTVALSVSLVLGAVGLLDDRRGLAPLPRLVMQVGAGIAFGVWLGGPLGGAVGALAFPIAVNVVNFMDGINGITSVTVTLWALCAVAVALQTRNTALAILGASTAGASLGFLPANLTGKIFLGDVGSYLFGAIVGAGVLIGVWQSGTAVLLLPMSIHLTDVLWTLLKRARRGTPLMEAHREHTYQRLANDLGMSHPAVSGIVAAFGLVICVVALTGPLAIALVVAGLASVAYLMTPWAISKMRVVTT